MSFVPETIEELKKYRYGSWAGNEKGWAYIENKCAEKVSSGWVFKQCSRKNGYGKNGLFCKQHAKHHSEEEK